MINYVSAEEHNQSVDAGIIDARQVCAILKLKFEHSYFLSTASRSTGVRQASSGVRNPEFHTVHESYPYDSRKCVHLFPDSIKRLIRHIKFRSGASAAGPHRPEAW